MASRSTTPLMWAPPRGGCASSAPDHDGVAGRDLPAAGGRPDRREQTGGSALWSAAQYRPAGSAAAPPTITAFGVDGVDQPGNSWPRTHRPPRPLYGGPVALSARRATSAKVTASPASRRSGRPSRAPAETLSGAVGAAGQRGSPIPGPGGATSPALCVRRATAVPGARSAADAGADRDGQDVARPRPPRGHLAEGEGVASLSTHREAEVGGELCTIVTARPIRDGSSTPDRPGAGRPRRRAHPACGERRPTRPPAPGRAGHHLDHGPGAGPRRCWGLAHVEQTGVPASTCDPVLVPPMSTPRSPLAPVPIAAALLGPSRRRVGCLCEGGPVAADHSRTADRPPTQQHHHAQRRRVGHAPSDQQRPPNMPRHPAELAARIILGTISSSSAAPSTASGRLPGTPEEALNWATPARPRNIPAAASLSG